jgi:glutathione S-transferase
VGGETEEWLRYRYYMHYAEGSLMSMLLIALFMERK